MNRTRNGISHGAEDVLRALAFMAREDRRLLVSEIAEGLQLAPKFLAKLLQALVGDGLVTSQKGRKGGFDLAVRPDRLTIEQVILAVDGSLPQYPFAGPVATKMLASYQAKTTIADLAKVKVRTLAAVRG